MNRARAHINCSRNSRANPAWQFRFSPAWLLLFIYCFTLAGAGARVQAQLTEHQMQAAVLANLAKFVEWPSEPNSEEPLRIGILGHDPFGSDLEEVVRELKVRGRSFRIQRARQISDLLDCQIIYFSERETDKLREAAATLRDRPILTVGESDRFLDFGGMVKFHMEDKRIRFAIHLGTAEGAGLSIHSQVLRLATEVIK